MTKSEFFTNASPEFKKGRRAVLEDIRKITDFSPRDLARQLLRDDMEMLRDDPLPEIGEIILSPAFQTYKDMLHEKIDGMIEGRSLYSVVNSSRINGYKSITDGDYAAGVRSAAVDVMTLLCSTDIHNLVKHCIQSTGVKEPYPDAYDNKQLYGKVGLGICMQLDDSLSRIGAKLGKAPGPKKIAFEGGPPGAMPRLGLAEIFGRFTDPSNHSTIMKSRTPSLWPDDKDIKIRQTMASLKKEPVRVRADDSKVLQNPSSAGGSSAPFRIPRNVSAQFPKDSDTAIEECLNRLSPIPENHNEHFVRGFHARLHEIFEEFQIRHFEKINSTGGYAAAMGELQQQNILFAEIAPIGHDDIRRVMAHQKRCKNTGRGQGESEEQGRKEAENFAREVMRNYIPPIPDSDTGRKKNAFLKLISHWLGELDRICEPEPDRPAKVNVNTGHPPSPGQ